MALQASDILAGVAGAHVAAPLVSTVVASAAGSAANARPAWIAKRPIRRQAVAPTPPDPGKERNDTLTGHEAYEVVFIIRDTLRDSIGSRRRDDPLPPPSQDWARLRAAPLEAEATWKATLRRDGFDVWSWIDQLDSTPET